MGSPDENRLKSGPKRETGSMIGPFFAIRMKKSGRGGLSGRRVEMLLKWFVNREHCSQHAWLHLGCSFMPIAAGPIFLTHARTLFLTWDGPTAAAAASFDSS
jgi:hypothetical protein